MKSYEKIENVFTLMNLPDDISMKEVIQIAQEDPCPLVRHEAVFALGEMGNFDAVPYLREIAKKDTSPIVVHEALNSLGNLGRPEEEFFLKSFLGDSREEVAITAQKSLDQLKNIEDFELLVQENFEEGCIRLDSFRNSSFERIQILFQLMRFETPEAVEAIGNCLLKDPCPIVRHEAGFILGEIGDLHSITFLGKSLEQESHEVVLHEVLFALGTTGKKESLEFIRPFLHHDSYIVRESAVIAQDRILFLKKPYSGLKFFN